MICAMIKHIEYFKTILDDKAVLLPSDNILGYESGWRGEVGKAAFVLRPQSSEEISKIITYCAAHKLHIIPQSGNTGMVANSVPDESGGQILLSLERMNTIIEIDPINKSAHVGAGVRLSALNAALEKHGLYFPIDLGSDPCLGGMVATNTGGSRYLKYRGVRENLMGVKAILADEKGTIIDALSPLHKNNTGLDVKQLFVGTGGAFGIISEVCVRLSPLPEQSAAALLVPTDMNAIATLLVEIEKSCANYLSAFEGMSQNAMERAFIHNPTLASPFGQDDIPHYAILLELSRSWPTREGEQSLDDVLEQTLAQIWERDDAPLENALIGDPEKLWTLRHSISEGVQKSGKLYAFDISFKRGDFLTFRALMIERLADKHPELTLCDFGHIGDGGAHFALVIDKSDARANDAGYEKSLRDWVNDVTVQEFGGSYSAEHGLGRKTQGAYDKYTPQQVKTLCRAIKSAIAPNDISTIKL